MSGKHLDVTPADVSSAGEDLCSLSIDLASAEGTWDGTVAGHGGATGQFGAPEAFEAMVTAWDKQLSTLYLALEELCGRVKGAANTYGYVDGHAYNGGTP